ncbi:NAD-dependent protein [Thozetella sp. PMI_491]|nr:NAD-dependent protein [Thozetella sp. PMI_491]
MHILVLGGSIFVGRAIVEEAVSRGHEVTVLNRGTNEAPKGARTIVGDRLAPGAYGGLDGLTFDAVIDTWGRTSEAVTSAVEALRGRFDHYTYISTLAAYDVDKIDSSRLYSEDADSYDVDAPNAEKRVYSYDKRRGEIAASASGVPTFMPRPGIILGPHERLGNAGGRLPWWLIRFQKGGRVVAPGPEDLVSKFIDVRDLATFVVSGVEQGFSGPYNVLSQLGSPNMRELLDAINAVTGGKAEYVWKDAEEIVAAGVRFALELPMWAPPKEHPEYNNFDTTKAREAGLVSRPFAETVRDTWHWMQTVDFQPTPDPGYRGPTLGLTPGHEAVLLK